MVKTVLIVLVFLLIQVQGFAQCAMCRASIENNVSNGETSIGAGLNTGILYLFAMPYLMAAVIGFFWYRNAKKGRSRIILHREKF